MVISLLTLIIIALSSSTHAMFKKPQALLINQSRCSTLVNNQHPLQLALQQNKEFTTKSNLQYLNNWPLHIHHTQQLPTQNLHHQQLCKQFISISIKKMNEHPNEPTISRDESFYLFITLFFIIPFIIYVFLSTLEPIIKPKPVHHTTLALKAFSIILLLQELYERACDAQNYLNYRLDPERTAKGQEMAERLHAILHQVHTCPYKSKLLNRLLSWYLGIEFQQIIYEASLEEKDLVIEGLQTIMNYCSAIENYTSSDTFVFTNNNQIYNLLHNTRSLEPLVAIMLESMYQKAQNQHLNIQFSQDFFNQNSFFNNLSKNYRDSFLLNIENKETIEHLLSQHAPLLCAHHTKILEKKLENIMHNDHIPCPAHHE